MLGCECAICSGGGVPLRPSRHSRRGTFQRRRLGVEVNRIGSRAMTPTACYSCDREAEFDQLPPRERIAYDEQWRVVHATNSGLLGWLVLVPRRHVMELAELTDAEAAGLGVWQVRLARALAKELHAPKTYVAEFGEVPGYHLHFHVVPRLPDLDSGLLGPGVFGFLGRSDHEEVTAADRDGIAVRLAAHMAS
jgi:diadenosine tetraphosphate (Ap4A) HIT family hydrolase